QPRTLPAWLCDRAGRKQVAAAWRGVGGFAHCLNRDTSQRLALIKFPFQPADSLLRVGAELLPPCCSVCAPRRPGQPREGRPTPLGRLAGTLLAQPQSRQETTMRFTSLFGRLMSGFRRGSRPRRLATARPAVEALETRTLPTVSFGGGGIFS